ncbi:hypothetical protein C5167_007365 [Papaver somniferum]|nr:hypothetical protein C5167_007365 [Papaver somniferum]
MKTDREFKSQDQKSAMKTDREFKVTDAYGLLVGDNVNKLANQAGKLVRVYCTVKYLDWREVPENLKEDVWFKLMQKFEFNVPNHLSKYIVRRSLPHKFRIRE